MQVRKAELADLQQIDAFDVFAGDRKPEILRGDIIVAIVNTEVAGYLMHNRNFYHRPFIWFVCVKESYRRQGVNKLLFGQVEKLYSQHPLIFTSTEDDNLPMLNFFEKYGYEPSGIIENIQKQRELIFVKRLGT